MHTSKCKLGWFALKLDLEKAFDRLEWDFIRLCLTNARIDNDTISLIMRCISSSSTQVALNGNLLSSFSPSRGIRQGDPLSPYLFILCMEALSTLIHKSCDDSDWSPFPLGKGGASFSHLLFADDILLFGRASEKNLCAVQDTLHTFCSSSGQKINFSKSKLLFSKHTSTVHTNMFETALGIKATSNLGTYLGFPLKGTKPNKTDLRHIVDAIQTKLSNWKTNFLSKAGRLCLINSTISAIPSHSMQCIRLPSSILGDIDKITRSFLWSGSSSKKLHLSNWDLVTLPLAHGGLGVKAARPLNDAYSMKLSWNILLNKKSLSSVAIRSKYPTLSPYSFRLGSHIWKNVGVGLPLLQDHTIWSIGDGDSVRLWTDCWSSLGPLRAVIHGPLTFSSSGAKLKSLIVNGAWTFDSLDFVLPDDMLNTILAIPLPSSSKHDILTTTLAPKDKFSISSAYSSLLNLRSWVRGWSRRFPAPNPFVSEVLAIREGLRAGLASMDSFIIASDCLIAVTSISSKAQPCGQFANVILECRDLLESSPRLMIVFEKRSANGVADALAKAGLVDSSPNNGCINWDVAPPFVLRLCTIDFVAAIEPLPRPSPVMSPNSVTLLFVVLI
ncbi:uncharacterized protein LOC141594598 [Silene latifolia]|uniref:uncharacterized protein LOC141594598 n=1 Tax=Silene latifolia TaxID=37657 RepID=UPI003D784AF2